MSQHRSLRDAVWECQGISASALVVALRLVEHWPRIFPSLATLARYTKLSQRSVTRALRELESSGIIRTAHHMGRSSTYEFVGVSIPDLGTPANTSGVAAPTPDTVSGDSCHIVGSTPDTMADEAVNSKQTSKAGKPRMRGQRSKRVPDSWLPKPSMRTECVGWGWSGAQWEFQLRKFRNHTFGAARIDWDSTFENWCITAEEGYARFRKPKEETYQEPDEYYQRPRT